MTGKEKGVIYDLLKTAADNLCGYKSEQFATTPEFFDDAVIEQNQNGVSSRLRSGQATAIANNELDTSSPLGVQSASLNGQSISLEKIASLLQNCKKCPLSEHRKNVVLGEGVKNPTVLVIGEAPGEEEDNSGRPFVGPAGQLLDKMLHAINLDRNTNCYIANIVKCRPPKNRTPYSDEAEICRPFLDAQIHILKPKMILCAGRCAIQNLLHTEEPLSHLRGQFFNYNGIEVMATYHPSALLRDASQKRPAWEDLKKFRERLTSME